MMLWALLEKVHGHLAMLAVAACLHPPIALRSSRRTSRAARISGYAASGLLIGSVAIGWFIYPEFRATIRARLYETNPLLGHAFEVKEHLGTYAIVLAAVGGVLMWLSRQSSSEALVPTIRRTYLAAAVLAGTAAAIGVTVASVIGFG
jgi:hypothetical protein